MTPLHCVFTLSLFWWLEPLKYINGWVFLLKGLKLQRTTLWASGSFWRRSQLLLINWRAPVTGTIFLSISVQGTRPYSIFASFCLRTDITDYYQPSQFLHCPSRPATWSFCLYLTRSCPEEEKNASKVCCLIWQINSLHLTCCPAVDGGNQVMGNHFLARQEATSGVTHPSSLLS